MAATKQLEPRKLDGLEKAFWLLNQNRSTHFCVVAEIEGSPSPGVWREAVEYIAVRLPFASARVLQGDDGLPHFHFDGEGEIPFSVIEGNPYSWPIYVENELAEFIDASKDPLLRMTLVYEADRSALIVTLHHSIGDGTSSVHLIRDLLRRASGQEVIIGGKSSSLERGVDELDMPDVSFPPAREDIGVDPPGYRSAAISRPVVVAGGMPAFRVDALREAARRESTTFHGALCAAAARAFAELRPDHAVIPPRVFSPVDARRRLFDGAEHLGAFINAITVDLPAFSTDFWDDARAYSSKVGLFNDPDVLAFGIRSVREAVSGNPTVAQTAAVWAQVYGGEVLVSNLGVLDLAHQYGGISLQAVWGPAVSTGIAEEQTLGISTFEGQLRILHTSFEPVEGFVDKIVAILLQQSAIAHKDLVK